MSFFSPGKAPRLDYASENLSKETIEDVGVFASGAVQGLVRKCEGRDTLGVRDNMTFVGVLSTQEVVRRFREEFHG